ncbi:uncharacterized protein G2W53_040088 [Senna tora]|uniref:Secreted protein n=1 Tax=Senna tora TaxID=362788 RepID=A0A834SQH7_9FABA|nr:uncharacterized protein G2W53_040088 [Senna tora]
MSKKKPSRRSQKLMFLTLCLVVVRCNFITVPAVRSKYCICYSHSHPIEGCKSFCSVEPAFRQV